jgi:cobalamin biosynthesis protein CbiG
MTDATLPESIPLERLAELDAVTKSVAEAETLLLQRRGIKQYVEGKLVADFKLGPADSTDLKTGKINRPEATKAPT